MFIITYATHSERYFPFLESHEIINLSISQKWNGWYSRIKSVISFCDTLHPNQIVCFIDGFDTIILGENTDLTKQEAILKFYESDCDILFSADNVPSISSHYFRFKIFGTCQYNLLSAGMYIGFAGAIKSFWSNIQINDDDQQYATKACRHKKIKTKIDIENNIFLNFYSERNITFSQHRIVMNTTGNMPLFLSGPGYQNLNHILMKIGYKKEELPEFKIEKQIQYYKNNIHTFWKYFLLDAIIVIILISFILVVVCSFTSKNKNHR